jgi:hypothetical protein
MKTIFLLCFSIVFLNASLLDEVKKEPMLMEMTESTFLKYNNHPYYISVGVSDMKNNSVRERVKAIKISKARAISNLSKFINDTRVKTLEQLNSVCKRDKTLSCKEEYLEIIQNKSAGFLNNFIDIGKIKQDNSYYYFIGIKIK